MADTKKLNRYFSIFDWEKEEAFLRKQHKKGWKLVRYTAPIQYTFEKCEPEDVIYQLDYNTEDSKENYIQTFTDCGWEYVQTFYGYAYFRKAVSAMKQEESIFSDSFSRLEMMRRVYRSRFGPIITMFCILLLDLVLCLSLFRKSFLTVLCIALIALYLVLFVLSAVKYARYKRKLEES